MKAAYLLTPRRCGRRLAYEVARWRIMKQISPDWRRWAVHRALRSRVKRSCWITTRRGARFCLGHDPIDDRIVEHICATAADLYFPAQAAPPPESLLLDVGAHHGIYAVEALRRYPGTRLIAVEPNPNAYDPLIRNLVGNVMLHRVEIVRAGIGKERGEAFLEYSPEGSWGDRTLPLSASSTLPCRAGARVRMLTLEEILGGRTPYLVKCTAEGAEFDLFPQMFALGIRPEIVVMMTHPHAGCANDLIALFERFGYSVQDADNPPLHARFHCRKGSIDRR